MLRTKLESPAATAPTPTFRDAFGQLYRFLRLIRAHWSGLLKGMVVGLFAGLLMVISPYLTKLIIDKVYPSEDITLLNLLVAGILGLSIASALLGCLRSYHAVHLTSRITIATNLLLFNHLQHLPIRFFDQHRVGEVTSRFGDVRSALSIVSRLVETMFINGIYLVLVPPLLLLLDWRLGLIALTAVPTTTVVAALAARRNRKHLQKTVEEYAALSAFQVEVLSHIRLFKAMALEPYAYNRVREQSQRVIGSQVRAGAITQLSGLANRCLHAASVALVTWFGWSMILRQEITLGDYIAFTMYSGFLYQPLFQIAVLFGDFQRSAVSIERMFEYMAITPEQDPSSAHSPYPAVRYPIRGDLALVGVSFGYAPERPVVTNVTMRIAAGTSTALVGPTGAGKSSLLRLLAGMETPDSGEILIDGRLSSEYPLPDLRRQLSMLGQDFTLLHGSIWDNLTAGIDNPREDAVDEVLRICSIRDMVRELPGGLSTPVAEWGASLSGGQRQRIALARTLIRNSPVTLLDEATSQVDVETEAEILNTLLSSNQDRTLIYVTHRMAAAALADQIFVVVAGCIEAAGTHENLLVESETYRSLCRASATPRDQDLVQGSAELHAPLIQ